MNQWRAHWIWDGRHDLRNSYLYLRKVFRLPAAPKRAVVRVSADSRYKLWVNGQFVCRGPARGYPSTQPYDTVDIAPYLRAGDNAICALAHHFGISTFQYLNRGGKGFILDGQAECNGGVVLLLTDTSWKVLRDPARKRRVARTSVQTGYQEHLDARLEPVGWLDPQFDDGGWRNASSEGTVPTMPWSSMEERGIPLLREQDTPAKAVVHQREGECAAGYADTENINATIAQEQREPAKEDRFIVATQNGKQLGQITVLPTPPGRFSALVVDFGREVAGFGKLRVSGAHGGEILDLAYMEGLNADGEFFVPNPAEGCEVAMADRLICREGDCELEGYGLRGFRYLLLVARDVKEPFTISFLGVREAGYPFNLDGDFECSDPMLNRIWEVGAYTQQMCAFDSYVDCPWREQAQWWGDARVQGLVTYYAYGDGRLIKRGIHQGAQSQTFEGLLWGIFPTDWPGGILPDYSVSWILSLRDHLLFHGDLTLGAHMIEPLAKVLAWFRQHGGDRRLLGPTPGRWLFLDWAPLDKSGYSATFTLTWLLGLQAAAQIAKWCGHDGLALLWDAEATAVAHTTEAAFWDEDAGVFRESVDMATGKRGEQISQHANALALLCGLRPNDTKRIVEGAILPPVLRSDSGVVEASSFYYAYVLEALFNRGYQVDHSYLKLALEFIKRRWGGMIERGATTFWEDWNSQVGWGSLCHAWSASPTYHLSQQILGVVPTAPGFTRAAIMPRAGGLTSAHGRVPTRHGQIHVTWEVAGGVMRGAVSIPPGMTAQVFGCDGSVTEALPGHTSFEWPVREGAL